MVCVRQHRCTLSEVLVELASLLRTVAAFATFIIGTQCFSPSALLAMRNQIRR